MKALEFLKNMRRMADSMKIVYFDDELDKAIKELESLQSKVTRVEFISKLGRESVYRCDDTKHYELSFQDDNRTLKLFVVRNKQ